VADEAPPAPKAERPLTPKMRAFVREYLVDFNGTQAAIRAGYSPQSANEQASSLLAKPNIKAAVAEKAANVAKKADISAEWVARELRRVYRLARKRKGMHGPDFTNAIRALENLGKLAKVGAFIDRVDHTTKGEAIKPAEPQVIVFAGKEVKF
jgi:phage terminase small subunit